MCLACFVVFVDRPALLMKVAVFSIVGGFFYPKIATKIAIYLYLQVFLLLASY